MPGSPAGASPGRSFWCCLLAAPLALVSEAEFTCALWGRRESCPRTGIIRTALDSAMAWVFRWESSGDGSGVPLHVVVSGRRPPRYGMHVQRAPGDGGCREDRLRWQKPQRVTRS